MISLSSLPTVVLTIPGRSLFKEAAGRFVRKHVHPEHLHAVVLNGEPTGISSDAEAETGFAYGVFHGFVQVAVGVGESYDFGL